MSQKKQLKVKEFSAGQSRSQRIAQVIFEHAARISRQEDIPAMAHLSADLARDLLGADRCSLWLLEQNTNELYTRVAHGIQEIRIHEGADIVGASVARQQPIRVNDIKRNRHFLSKVDDA